jgi:SAM-dependent methyltransferase
VAPDRLETTRRMWSTGDYASVGDMFAEAGATLVECAGVAGLEVLDVATGTGNTARAAARAGAARVVGIDATPHLLEEAARRSVQSGLDVEWREGDMEALSVDDASFDRVLSSFGAIFAADQHQTAAELVRVCRPGGRIGLTAWAHGSLFDRMTAVLASRFPTPSPATPRPGTGRRAPNWSGSSPGSRSTWPWSSEASPPRSPRRRPRSSSSSPGPP